MTWRRTWDWKCRGRIDKKTGDAVVSLWRWVVVREHVEHTAWNSPTIVIDEPGVVTKQRIDVRIRRAEWCGTSPNDEFNAHWCVMKKLAEVLPQSDLCALY